MLKFCKLEYNFVQKYFNLENFHSKKSILKNNVDLITVATLRYFKFLLS